MRIAFVVGGFPEISETFILDQITGLIDRGHQVMILARPPADPQAQRHASVDEYGLMQRVLYWDSPRGGLPAILARTRRLLVSRPAGTVLDFARCLGALWQGENLPRLWSRVSMARLAQMPDLILAHYGTNAVIAQWVREVGALDAPLVAVFHGYDLSRLLRERKPDFYERLFAQGDLMLPVSDYFRRRLIAMGCPSDKILVHRMGVDARGLAFRERSASPGEPIRFVSVCRLVEKKGLDVGLQAFALLCRDLPRVTWHIVGDGPLRAQLEGLRQAAQLTEHVVVHGPKPREFVRQLLDQSHIFLAPSVTAADGDEEGIPVAIMEAMATGLPVVSTRHSGIPELVQDGVTGLLVPERDPDALAQALRQLARAPERWGEMGRRGRAIVDQEYDIGVLNDRLEQILIGVAGRHR